MEKNVVELTPVQAGVYWCINIIRNKVREINYSSTATDNEICFSSIFYSYTDMEWRKVYLELVEHFMEIANNDSYLFFLDTEIGGHDVLNAILSKVVNTNIPDISLASNFTKDSVINIKKDSAVVWYKSCGDIPLSLDYESDYILTGNQDELEIYNVLIATLSMLGTLDPGFRSISELRSRFCKEFKKINKLEDSLETITERFNLAYKKANERGLVNGSVYSTNFYPHIGSMDIAALEDYMDKGHHYADVVLQREKVFPLPVDNKLKKEN